MLNHTIKSKMQDFAETLSCYFSMCKSKMNHFAAKYSLLSLLLKPNSDKEITNEQYVVKNKFNAKLR